jgi:hypothetical protein
VSWRPRDCFVRVITAALATWPLLCSVARAEIVAGGGLSGNVEYTSNPYLLNSGDVSAVRASVTVSPFIENRTARSSLRIASNATVSAFSRRYNETIDLSNQVDYRVSLTRQLSVRAGVSLYSTVGDTYRINNIFAPVTNPAVAPPIIDLTIIGSQDRTVQATGSVGASYAINDKNSLSLDYSGSVARYPNALFRSEFSTVQQSLTYSRTINARMSAGASVGVTKVNYFRTARGDALIISPSINGSMRISSTWLVSGSIGVSFTQVDIGFFKLKSQNLSGSLNACRTGIRTTACVVASRSTSASSFDGVRTTTSVGLNYNYRLGARDTLSATGGYSRSVAPQELGTSGAIDYLSGSVTWSHRLSDRLSANAAAGFARSGFQDSRQNATVSIGINYSFGNR